MKSRCEADTYESVAELLDGKDVLAVATSVYQVFVLLSIVGDERSRTFKSFDLIISDVPSMLVPIAKRLEEGGLFSSVICKDFGYLKSSHALRRYILNGAFRKRAVRNGFIALTKGCLRESYEVFLYSSYTPLALDAKEYAASSAMSVIFEDGTGAYNGFVYRTELCGDRIGLRNTDFPEVRKRALKRFICRVLIGSKSRICPRYQIVFQPSLLADCIKQSLPVLSVSPLGDKMQYRILLTGEDAAGFLDGVRVIFFTLPDNSPSIMLEREEEILGYITEAIDGGVVVKPHPGRSDLSRFEKTGAQVLPSRYSWEALLACGMVPEDCILAGSYSTAQITPKTLFDMEPELLFCYRLMGYQPDAEARMLGNIEGVRHLYRYSGKILVPDSRKSLQAVLRNEA